jgi:hypothetical protein
MSTPTPDPAAPVGLDLDALKELLAEATPGPWKRAEPPHEDPNFDHGWTHHPCHDIETEDGKKAVVSSSGYDADSVEAENADIDLIVAGVNALPALLDLVSRQQEAIQEVIYWYENDEITPVEQEDAVFESLRWALQQILARPQER